MDDAGGHDEPTHPEPWPVESRETAFECPWLAVEREAVRRPDGVLDDYYHVDLGGDAVVVLAESDEGLVLVSEYRPTLGVRLVTPPGGRIEDDSDVADAARRELREETGYEAGDVEVLQAYRPTSVVRKTRYVVYADDLTRGDATPDDEEFIDVLHVTVEEALDRAREDGAAGWFLTALLVARDEGVL